MRRVGQVGRACPPSLAAKCNTGERSRVGRVRRMGGDKGRALDWIEPGLDVVRL